jgi:uncharacterized membrane protein
MSRILVGIGIVLIVIGLALGYFSGVAMEHSAITVNITSVVANYLKDMTIGVILVIAGGLIVIFGSEKRLNLKKQKCPKWTGIFVLSVALFLLLILTKIFAYFQLNMPESRRYFSFLPIQSFEHAS